MAGEKKARALQYAGCDGALMACCPASVQPFINGLALLDPKKSRPQFRHLLEQREFQITNIPGHPAPYPLVVEDKPVAGLFSKQRMLHLVPNMFVFIELLRSPCHRYPRIL
jgi:hypothetical protein